MNVKMPTIVSILTFMSRLNLVLSCVEHGKSFITSGPVYLDEMPENISPESTLVQVFPLVNGKPWQHGSKTKKS